MHYEFISESDSQIWPFHLIIQATAPVEILIITTETSTVSQLASLLPSGCWQNLFPYSCKTHVTLLHQGQQEREFVP